MNQKVVYYLKDIGKLAGLLLLIFVVFYASFTYIPFLNKYEEFVVVTGSMDPVIKPGEFVILDNSIAPEDIKVGDIVAFYVDVTNDGIDDTVIHYIDEINEIDGQLTYRTISEVSDTRDNWTIEESDIIGVYQYKVPYIGNFILFFQSWIGKLVIFVDIIVIYALVTYLFPEKKKKPPQTIENTIE